MVPVMWKFPTKNHGFVARGCLILEGRDEKVRFWFVRNTFF